MPMYLRMQDRLSSLFKETSVQYNQEHGTEYSVPVPASMLLFMCQTFTIDKMPHYKKSRVGAARSSISVLLLFH